MMDKLIELAAKVIENRPPETIKPVLVMIGSVMLAEKFKHPDWLKTIKEQSEND